MTNSPKQNDFVKVNIGGLISRCHVADVDEINNKFKIYPLLPPGMQDFDGWVDMAIVTVLH